MRVSSSYSSPNFSPDLIPVDFVVLHYTAADLKRTMGFFSDPQRKVCSHFVLDTDGTVYDLGGFLSGSPIRQAAHAGISRLMVDGVEFTVLNKMSIGIEIINLNGNLLPYTEAQYEALIELLRTLIARFPKLAVPGHITGHEQIAGFRGKCDPGILFDWRRVLKALQLTLLPQHQQFVFSKDDQAFAQDFLKQNPNPDELTWSKLSSQLEERIQKRLGYKKPS